MASAKPVRLGWPVGITSYRLTIFLSISALVAIGSAGFIVNGVIGNRAQKSLVKQAQEGTVQKGSHMESMMRGLYETHGATSGQPIGQPMSLYMKRGRFSRWLP